MQREELKIELKELKAAEKKEVFNKIIHYFDIIFISIFTGFGFMCLFLIVKANPIFSILYGFSICASVMFFEAKRYF